MKMIMAVVPRDEAAMVLNALIAAGHTATFTESRGGMLRQAQYTLFIAVEDAALVRVLGIISDSCHSDVAVEPRAAMESESVTPVGPAAATARVGGAVVFVWDLEQFAVY